MRVAVSHPLLESVPDRLARSCRLRPLSLCVQMFSSGSTFLSCLRDVECVRSLLFSLVPFSCSGVPWVSSPTPDRPAAPHQPRTNTAMVEGLHKTLVDTVPSNS